MSWHCSHSRWVCSPPLIFSVSVLTEAPRAVPSQHPKRLLTVKLVIEINHDVWGGPSRVYKIVWVGLRTCKAGKHERALVTDGALYHETDHRWKVGFKLSSSDY